MDSALKKFIFSLLIALSIFSGSISPAAAQEAPAADDGLNIACLASDIGAIGTPLASVIPGAQTLLPILGVIGGIGKSAAGDDCALGDGISGVTGAIGDAVKDKIYDSTLGKFIESLLIANGQLLKTIFSWWIAVPTIDMGDFGALDGASPEQILDIANQAGQAYSDATGEANPIAGLTDLAGEESVERVGPGGDLGGLANPVSEEGSSLLSTINDYTGTIQIWLLMIGIMLGLVRIAWARQQAQGQESMEMVKGLWRAVFIASGFSVLITLGTRFSDNLATWWMAEMVQPDQLAKFSERILLLSTSPLAAALVFIVGLLGLLAAIVQVAIIIIRNALLVVVVAVMPLAAAASLTRAGNSSVEKLMGWAIALVLFKPVAALVYSIAISLIGSSSDPWETITGMALLAMAVMTLPALMAMVAPAVQSVGGGASGMGIAGAAVGAAATGAAMVATGGAAAGAIGGGATKVGALSKSGAAGAAGGGSPTGAGAAGSGLLPGGGGAGGSGAGSAESVTSGAGLSGASGTEIGADPTATPGGAENIPSPGGAGGTSGTVGTPSPRGAGGAGSIPSPGGAGASFASNAAQSVQQSVSSAEDFINEHTGGFDQPTGGK